MRKYGPKNGHLDSKKFRFQRRDGVDFLQDESGNASPSRTSSPGGGYYPRVLGIVTRTRALLQIVDLDEPHTGRVILPADDGGAVAGSESRYQGRFQIVCRWNCRRLDLRLLTAAIRPRLPVVVARDRSSTSVVQLKSRIGQNACDGNRWSQCAHNHFGSPASATADDQPADHDVVTRVNKTSRADVRQLGICALRQIVNLNKPNTRSPILAGKDSRVSPRTKRYQDCRLQVVRRRNCRGPDVSFLRLAGLIVDFPVIVGRWCCVALMG